MPRFPSTLQERLEVAEGTVAFAFERPSGFDFVAGQYAHLVLPNPPHTDAGGNRRTFSMASAPQEADRIRFVTRLTGSAMKRSLMEVPLGSPVEILGPAGAFALHDDPAVPAVFVAGGIGITPFRSMVQDAVRRGLPHRIALVYSNRNAEGAAFHDEFVRLSEVHAGFTYLPTMTQAAASRTPWPGERRYVDAAFLRDRIGNVATPIFYLAGPPGLVTAVSKALVEAGADPARIRAEEFMGY